MAAETLPPASMSPVDDLPPEPASWPKVVGVISIVYSGLFLTCTGCGMGMLSLLPRMMAGTPGIDEGFPPSMQMYPMKIGATALSVLGLLLLLAAGITTIMRRPAGRPLHLTWAVFSLVMAAVMLFAVQLPEMALDQQWYKDHPASPFAKNASGGASGPIKYATMAIFMMLGLSWPVFCLVWFGMVKRDARDLDRGGPEPAA